MVQQHAEQAWLHAVYAALHCRRTLLAHKPRQERQQACSVLLGLGCL